MNKDSYLHGLRSTSLLGGAQIFNVVVSVLKNKFVTIFLGSLGIGIISVFQSILDLIRASTSIGFETTGVREVALSCTNSTQINNTTSLICIWSWILAILGSVLCFLFQAEICFWAFKSYSHQSDIAWLSIAVFFTTLASGEFVILQGLGQINLIIKSGLLSSTLILLILIPVYYFYKLQGIVPIFILGSIITYLSNVLFRKQLDVRIHRMSLYLIITKGKFIFKIGCFVVLASIQTQITLLLVKSLIIKWDSLESLGLVEATWTITNVYLTLILKSISADFYPRISKLTENKIKLNQEINNQIHMMVLISLPIIILLLLFSKPLLAYLYSDSFVVMHSLLNWRALGVFFKITAWILSFVLLARGYGFLYFVTDLFYSIVYLFFVYLLFPHFKLQSIGIAYTLAYFLSLMLLSFILIKKDFFCWNKANLRITTCSFLIIIVIFCCSQYFFHNYKLYLIGVPLFFVSCFWVKYELNKILSLKELFMTKRK